MAKGAKSPPPGKNKYSVILPTYNERQNLPVLVQMLYDVFTQECVYTLPVGLPTDAKPDT